MEFPLTRAVASPQDLAEALYSDLAGQEEKLPIERYCIKGGWPLNTKVSTIAILENSALTLRLVLYVSFTESGAACCSGDNFEHERFEELILEIDRADWSCSFPASDREGAIE